VPFVVGYHNGKQVAEFVGAASSHTGIVKLAMLTMPAMLDL